MTRHRTAKKSWATAALLLCFAMVAAAMGQTEATPSIVFAGTVDAVEAVALPGLTASPDTCVVSVDKVIQKPDAVALAPGDKVTVLTPEGKTPQQGAHGLFYTEGWVFGETLAVRALRWETADAGMAAAAPSLEAKAAAQQKAAADKELKAKIDKADVIVVGRVKKVQPPTVAELAPEQPIISEHNPDWQEATIEVQSVLKGTKGMSQVVVRFPGSVDVMWVSYPKFQEGQEGTFLLTKDSVSGTSKAMVAGKEVVAYVAQHTQDVRTKAASADVKRLMKSH